MELNLIDFQGSFDGFRTHEFGKGPKAVV